MKPYRKYVGIIVSLVFVLTLIVSPLAASAADGVNSPQQGAAKDAKISAGAPPTVKIVLNDTYIREASTELLVNATLGGSLNATLVLGIYSKDGTVKYAEKSQPDLAPLDPDPHHLYWDGKATETVAAEGIAAGDYLPASESGTEYLVKVTAQNTLGSDSKTKILKLYPKPIISNVSIYPGSFMLGYPNTLKISGSVKAPPDSMLRADIYTSGGQTTLDTGMYMPYSGENVVFNWDGKYDEDSDGIMIYVPASASGTTYKVKLGVYGSGFDMESDFMTFKVFPSTLKIKKVSISGKTFKATASGKKKAKFGVKLSKMSNVEVKIYDKKYKKVYAVLTKAYVKANKTAYLYWNGKATEGNTAGLTAGNLVPAGKYKIKVFAGGKTGKPSSVITVKR
jgi:hypothetical protein